MESLGDAITRVVTKARSGPPDPEPGEPRPVACARCGGAEWLRMDVPVDDPRFGQATPCPDCAPVVMQRRLNRLWGELPAKFKGWSMDSFIEHASQLGALDTVALAEEIRDNWLPTDLWLFLWGRPGRGKTGLAIGLLVECIRRGQSGLFKVVPDMLDSIRSSYRNQDAMSEDSRGVALLNSLYNVDVLVLDDLGVEKSSDWVAATLYQIIGHRHANLKRTIVTSNYNLEDLAEHLGHPRTPSRIRELTDDGAWEVPLVGTNLRTRPTS